MDAHEVSFSAAIARAAEKCVEDSGLPSGRQEGAVSGVNIFATVARRDDSGLVFFTYALGMEFVLGVDGRRHKDGMRVDGPAGKIIARSISGPSNPYRVGVESATREIEKAADLCLREAGTRRDAVAAIGAGLAGTGNPELKEAMRASLAADFPAQLSVFLRIWRPRSRLLIQDR